MAQSILVTGSSSGLGRRISETLARHGHTVFAAMRNTRGTNAAVAAALSAWAQQADLDLQVLDMDVTDDRSVHDAVQQVVDRSGRIDVVVNNAGVMVVGLSEACTLDQMRHMYDVNLFGVLRVNRAVLPLMRRQQSGLLMYLSSGGASLIYPFMGLYGASKAALEAMAETIHYEVYRFGIDTTIVQAGTYATNLATNVQVTADQQVWESYGSVGQIAQAFTQGFPIALSPERAEDPQPLADLVAQTIELPRGQRPLKVPIGAYTEGVGAINEAIQQVQQHVLPALGLEMLLERDPYSSSR
jgi:NAD(P)-dependent dehydrogenase (short-subunit alcohol dehydrogenase family)